MLIIPAIDLKDGRCVAVGSAGVWNGIGGLYSVATRHDVRRRGLGADLSTAATQWAFEHGARGVLLQTVPHSGVEKLYASLGYRASYIGRLLVVD